MRFAVIGLAFTHPYAYTELLQRTGHQVVWVWDDLPERLADFVARYGATPAGSLADIPAGELDGVIVTGRFPERVDHAVHFLERGLPVYASKPMATSAAQLERLEETV